MMKCLEAWWGTAFAPALLTSFVLCLHHSFQLPRIPADIRIVESYDLKVECSSLTGESDLVPVTVDRHHDMAAGAVMENAAR